MSITRTFTVTVVSTGSGNKYFIDGVQQATINLGEGGTYKFDQSDSSNSTHPLRFSSTSDGTHNSGSEYTTGVTTNGTPGSSGAYTQITVAASAPTLYYYCSSHPGMGGQANTVDGNSWGIFAWGVNEYGDQDSVDISLTAPSTLTSAVGAIEAFNEEGWGRQEWGNSGWGVQYAVELTSVQGQLTSSIGSVTTVIAVPLTAPTGLTSSLGTPTLDLTSIAALTAPGQMTSEVGDFDNAGTLVGWGRNGWGEEPYGDSFNKLVQPAGVSATSSVGSLTTAVENFVPLTAPSQITASVGSLTLDLTSVISPTAPSQLTSQVGAPLITQATVGLTGLQATSAVGGVVLDQIVVSPIGQSATVSVGLIQEQISQIPTGQQATSSVGSLIVEIGVPLTAPSTATSNVGAIAPTEMTVGLSGQEATSAVGALGIRAYQNVVIDGNTSYSDVSKNNSASYSDVDNTAETSYTDVTAA